MGRGGFAAAGLGRGGSVPGSRRHPARTGERTLAGGLASLAAGGRLLGAIAAAAAALAAAALAAPLAAAALLAALLRGAGRVRDRRGTRLAHALLAKALVLLVVLDTRSM